MAKGTKGRFHPKRPDKYIGDVEKIIFRSRWEFQFMKFCDNNTQIIKWASEEIKIPYIKPTDGMRHYYFPDFFIETKSSKGVKRYLIEIKPHKESARTKKTSMTDQIAIAINEAKWKAAQAFCQKAGVEFLVLTEKTMFKV